MKYAKKLTESLNCATTATVASAAVLTWFFSAMQCNKEYCYTVDNPITQVALAGALAVGTIMAATSAPVSKAIESYASPITQRVTQATNYLSNLLTTKADAKKNSATPAATTTTVTDPTDDKIATPEATTRLPITHSSNLFSLPRSYSTQTNASETSPPSPSGSTPPHLPSPINSP